MTTPSVQTIKRGGSRFYVHPDTAAKVPGVTSIVGNLPKPFLKFWGEKLVAEEAVDNISAVTSLLVNGKRQAAIDMLKGAPRRTTSDAAQMGTDVHGLVEQLNRGEKLPRLHPDLQPWIDQYKQWLDTWQPEFLFVEATAWSETYGYAGTLDGICRVEGDLLMWDLKTGKATYPEVGLQLSAYANADYLIAADGTKTDLPKIELGAVLHLRPDTHTFKPVRIDADVFAVFKSLIQVTQWINETSKTVLGAPLKQEK
jgi:hypothetical protein